MHFPLLPSGGFPKLGVPYWGPYYKGILLFGGSPVFVNPHLVLHYNISLTLPGTISNQVSRAPQDAMPWNDRERIPNTDPVSMISGKALATTAKLLDLTARLGIFTDAFL